ncbi:hypothetical protein GYMLUDRAFT_394703 [Collybiopsis luxurians FD-317 M1]|uniref:Uncharacterized protein n=1 Tax=Collybiopsis luxurians FD-317 M1 TaxID=944289 RepID=A0A0D0C990_9AGAR|nr:hypothetical protein GYMLUDRAFT_394703 [Collybiopsis luxurians FD-317 M1]
MIIPSVPNLQELVVRSDNSTAGASNSSSSDSSSCNDINNCRTLLQIIWSCVSVLIACTWASVHPNVPAPDEGSKKVFRRKIGLMIMALIAPEMLVLWAARQWFAAKKLSKGYKGWTRTHSFFALMGGVALYEREKFISVLRFIPPDSGQRQIFLESIRSSGKIQSSHASSTNYAVKVKNHTNTRFDDRSFAAHAKSISRMKAHEIKDRSHSDWFGKLVAVGQTSWFIVQLLARWIEGLPVTALEVMTLAFAAMNILIYFFWWDKPQEIGYHIHVQRIASRTRANRERIVERADSDDDDPPDIPVLPNSGPWIFLAWNWLRETFKNSIRSLGRKIHGWWSNYFGRNFTGNTLVDAVLNIALVIYYIIWGPFNALMNSFIIREEDELLLEFPSERVRSFERIPGLEPTNAMDKCVAYGAAVMFGAIHCAGWASQFPDTIEEWLWRYSSLVVTGIPIYLAFVNVVHYMVDAKSRSRWWFTLLRWIYLFAVPTYIIARLALIIQAFLTLRNLSPDTFKAVQWTTFIPHIY